jgi:hypothetical protein
MFVFDKKKESTERVFNAKLLSDFSKESAAKESQNFIYVLLRHNIGCFSR